jgi:hypothetical protein
MFHAELRQFPHATRAFNLTREELQARILEAWVAGRLVRLDEHNWSPEKAKLKIIEGPALEPAEIGMGRGWSNAERAGEDVTARVLAEAQQAAAGPSPDSEQERLAADLLERAATTPLPVATLLSIANARYPSWRVSERLTLAETTVWRLLHEGRLELLRAGEPIAREGWQPALLAWETWAGASDVSVRALSPGEGALTP